MARHFHESQSTALGHAGGRAYVGRTGGEAARRTGLHMDAQKKAWAVEFINSIREMDPQILNALIVREAGEELAQFFLSYSANLISKDPERVLENTSSLMLMGYLIRANEEGQDAMTGPTLQA